MQKQQNSLIVIIFTHLAVIFTVFSQIRIMQSYFRPLMFVCWAIALLYSFLAKRAIYINSFIKTFILAMLFILLHNTVASFVYSEFQISNYFNVALIPLFVFFTMFQVAGYITPEHFKKILITYCICAVVLAIYLHIEYIPSLNSWLSSQVYIYSSKNSAAQIFISASIIMIFYFNDSDKKTIVLRFGASLYLMIISMFLQCRTAILGFACVLFFHFIIRSSAMKKTAFIAVAILVIILFITNETLFEIFEHTFGFDKYENATVNDLSSGRLDLYKLAFEKFAENPLLGKIYYYVDCMYISVYTALGIFGGTALMLPWFKRISRNFKALKFAMNHKTQINLEQTVCYLTVFYIVESLLEGQPPFGPGACSAMFWLICSYMDYTYYKPPKGSFKPVTKQELLELGR